MTGGGAGRTPNRRRDMRLKGLPPATFLWGEASGGGVDEEPFDSQTRSGQVLNEECEDDEE